MNNTKRRNAFVLFLVFLGILSLVIFIPQVRDMLLVFGEKISGATLTQGEFHDGIVSNLKNCEILFLLFIALIIVLLLIDFSNLENDRRLIVFSLILIVFSTSILLLFHEINLGHDGRFHLMRIAGIADELSRGHFPVRLQQLWLEGYGYPVSIYYGDILLYFPALLHLAGLALSTAYKFYMLAINLGTVLISFYCFKKIFKSNTNSLLLTLVYSTASYRLLCVYVRHAVGEYTAFMVFPIIVLAFYEMYYSESFNVFKTATKLAVGVSCIILSHILSSEIVILTLVIVCLVYWKKTFTKKNLLCILIAAFEAVLICAFFIVPFLDYFINVKVRISQLQPLQIQGTGVYLSEYFMFFTNPFVHYSRIFKSDGRMLFSPGIALMAGFVLSIIYLVRVQRDRKLIMLLIMSCIAIFISSHYFPWNALSKTHIGKIMSQIQFAWRWLGIVMIFLTLLLGRLLVLYSNENQQQGSTSRISKSKKFVKPKLFVIMVILNTAFLIPNFMLQTKHVYIKDASTFGPDSVSSGEYLRTGSDLQALTGEVKLGDIQISDYERKENSFSFHAKSDQGGYVELPVFNYKGYRALAKDNRNLEITDGSNNVVRVLVPAGFDSDLTVEFIEPLFWKISSIVSLLSVLALIVISLVFRKGKNEKE